MAPELSQICNICRWQLQLTDRVCLTNTLAIFQISSAQYPITARVAVVYFIVQSCLLGLYQHTQKWWIDGEVHLVCLRLVGNQSEAEWG